jgi:UDP-glucose 4-epimerase
MTKVLVTGANGFVGNVLCQQLVTEGFKVRGAYRTKTTADSCPNNIEKVIVGEINSNTDWQEALQDVNIIIHLAARVHVMQETETDPLSAFEAVNTLGTLNLAEQAASSGIKRLIFLSTIKVNGDQTEKVYSASDVVNPSDPYALSKWHAEQGLQAIRKKSGMEIVIIRPPLVYGPQVKGNFLRLIKLINKGLPIPLSSVKNKRSMVSIDNLCDLIKTCLVHAKADGEVFLVSDGHDLSTPELIRLISNALQKSARLLPFPVHWLYFFASLVHKRQEVERLCGSLLVEIKKNQEILNWQPPFTVSEGIRKTVTHHLSHHPQSS